MIGSFGDIVFEVSDKRIRTISDFQRTTSARWTTHEINGHTPISQFLGPGQDVVNFNISLKVEHGVNPKNEVIRLMDICRDGKVHKMFIGTWCLGRAKWYIESVGQAHDHIDHNGNILSVTTSVTLKEYA